MYSPRFKGIYGDLPSPCVGIQLALFRQSTGIYKKGKVGRDRDLQKRKGEKVVNYRDLQKGKGRER